MKPKTISSSLTFIYKFIFSTVWISVFGFGTIMLWVDALKGKDGTLPPPDEKWIFLVFWIAGSTFVLWGCAGLKKVILDDKSLRVSNFSQEIVILPDMIAQITENRWINIHPITIHFRAPTEFGSSITFMPEMRFLNWGSHPVIAELTQFVNKSRL